LPSCSADRFLFLEQRQGLLQPAPRLQDQRLIAVPGLQRASIVSSLGRPLYVFAEIMRFGQTPPAPRERITEITEIPGEAPAPGIRVRLREVQGLPEIRKIFFTLAPVCFRCFPTLEYL
jgi:hypothetical protein